MCFSLCFFSVYTSVYIYIYVDDTSSNFINIQIPITLSILVISITFTNCLGLGHETLVCAACLSIFLLWISHHFIIYLEFEDEFNFFPIWTTYIIPQNMKLIICNRCKWRDNLHIIMILELGGAILSPHRIWWVYYYHYLIFFVNCEASGFNPRKHMGTQKDI